MTGRMTGPRLPKNPLVLVGSAGLVVLALTLLVHLARAGDLPLTTSPSDAAEDAALAWATAAIESDYRRQCSLETVDHRAGDGTLEDCVSSRGGAGDGLLPTGPIEIIGSVDLGDEVAGIGVGLTYHLPAGVSATATDTGRGAVQMVQVDGEWLVSAHEDITTDDLASAAAHGVDEIAVALGYDHVPARS